MNNTDQQIIDWINKLSELEQDCPREAYEMLNQGKDYALQAFKQGIKTYDLETLLIRIYLETSHFTEASNVPLFC